jgi:hypothetical protein
MYELDLEVTRPTFPEVRMAASSLRLRIEDQAKENVIYSSYKSCFGRTARIGMMFVGHCTC